jgi:hypothetical protein
MVQKAQSPSISCLSVLSSPVFMNFNFSIPLEPVLQEGSLSPEVHRVVKEEEYCGEIKLALTFTPSQVT